MKKNGILKIDNVSSEYIVEKYGTPVIVMEENKIRKNCQLYKNSIDEFYEGKGMVYYASKAFSCKEIYRIIMDEGLGIDIVSKGELYTALSVGFPVENIIFHGNNKSEEELRYAIENNIGRIVIDNVEEISIISDLAKKYSKIINVILRVKPGVDAHTHDFIKTGQIDSKFGFGIENQEAIEIIKCILKYKNIKFKGIHCHIGSQIFSIDPFIHTAEIMMHFILDIKKQFDIDIEELNLGGGYGIKYINSDDPPDYREYMKEISKIIFKISKDNGIKVPYIMMEPGRSIVGESGTTLYTVGGEKCIKNIRNYLSIDGGMIDNPRYILYQAEYDMIIGNKCDLKKDKLYTIAGKCCESGDIIGKNILLQDAEKGDILAVFSTGAYNYSMASNYNRIPRPSVISVKDGKDKLIVKRESYDDILKNDI